MEGWVYEISWGRAQATLLMDVHAHLSGSEVIGLLGGTWEPESRRICVSRAFPCRRAPGTHSGTSVELDPAAEVETRALMQAQSLTPVGWWGTRRNPATLPGTSYLTPALNLSLRTEVTSCLQYTCGRSFPEASFSEVKVEANACQCMPSRSRSCGFFWARKMRRLIVLQCMRALQVPLAPGVRAQALPEGRREPAQLPGPVPLRHQRPGAVPGHHCGAVRRPAALAGQQHIPCPPRSAEKDMPLSRGQLRAVVWLLCRPRA